MRESQDLPSFTVSKFRVSVLLGIALIGLCAGGAPGCKRRIKEKRIPQKILQAKTASFSELLGIINGYDRISDLKANGLEITLTTYSNNRRRETQWHSVPGYVLLRRPDLLHLTLQNPLSKATEADVISVGDEMGLWVHKNNKFYIGKNSAKELIAEDLQEYQDFLRMRPSHIFDALLPKGMSPDAPGIRISMEEAADANAKYYVISVFKEGRLPRIYILRKIWIERSEMVISRIQTFIEDGQVAADIEYSNPERVDDIMLPRNICMDRPLDGYMLNMEVKGKGWRTNSGVPDAAFNLKPEGVQVVPLREK
jgi:hypothetical protein